MAVNLMIKQICFLLIADNSRVLLFVILGNSRSLAAMNEAAFYIGQAGTSVVLVVQSISPDTEVSTDAYQR